jgi:galactose oxidase
LTQGNPASNAIDGQAASIWHSEWNVASPPPYPHHITLDMGQTNTVNGLQYLPRQDGNSNGFIGGFEVRLCAGPTCTADANFGAAVATGTWANSALQKTATWTAAPARAVRLRALTTASSGPWASAAEINILGPGGTPPPPPGANTPPANPVILPRGGFTAIASDQNSAGEAAGLVLDGNRDTFWHSKYDNGLVALPHTITITFGGSRNIAGVVILPRQDGGSNGNIGQYTIGAQSSAGAGFVRVASGTFADTRGPKTVTFAGRAAVAVRIIASTEAGNRGTWTSIAEVNILGYTGGIPAREAGRYGLMGPMINMPIVPVAAALLPNGRVWP